MAEEAYDVDRMASVVELLQCYLDYFDDSRACYLYGDALRVLGKKGAAAVSLVNAERMCPPQHKWAVQAGLAQLFHDAGDFSTAERWFSLALESEQAHQESWMWILRGANFARQELLDEAEACHRRAIAVNANDEEAYLNLAMVCRAQRRYEEARSAAETALAICPDYPSAKELLRSLEGAEESRELVERLRHLDLGD